MPKITFDGQTISCKPGENLRRVLMAAKLPLYTPAARVIHCRGMGTCGTCSLRVRGSVTSMTRVERWRLGFPPHTMAKSTEYDLRLACQVRVLGNLELEKLGGMWGNKASS